MTLRLDLGLCLAVFKTTFGVPVFVPEGADGLVLGPLDPAAEAFEVSSDAAGESVTLAPFKAFCLGIFGDLSLLLGTAS